MIITVAVSGYRSIRELVLPLEKLTIITGPNGSGKSSFYRAIRLLADVAQGRAIAALAHEGGLQSTLWAGPENITREMKRGEYAIQGGPRSGPVSLKLGFADQDHGYAIDLGLPVPAGSLFDRDPEIKAEALWIGEALRRSNTIATRNGPCVQVLKEDGTREIVLKNLTGFDSMMTHAADTGDALELLSVREKMRLWRFYDHLRTDQDAPSRRVQIGTRSPSLAPDGSDLAAAIQTIMEIGDRSGFTDAVSDAFPGSTVEISENDGRFEILVRQHGMLRPLNAAELSDGTLRYLLLTAALLTPRPPPLIVLNEPETSLHRSLLAPLARLISAAKQNTQIIMVTHATELTEALKDEAETECYELRKEFGQTLVDDVDPVAWAWPSR